MASKLIFLYYKRNGKKGLERADIILGISDTEANYYRDLVDKSCIWLGHSFEKRFISSKKRFQKYAMGLLAVKIRLIQKM